MYNINYNTIYIAVIAMSLTENTINLAGLWGHRLHFPPFSVAV